MKGFLAITKDMNIGDNYFFVYASISELLRKTNSKTYSVYEVSFDVYEGYDPLDGEYSCKEITFLKPVEDINVLLSVNDEESALNYSIFFSYDAMLLRYIKTSYYARAWAEKFPNDKNKLIHLMKNSVQCMGWILNHPEDRNILKEFLEGYEIIHYVEKYNEDKYLLGKLTQLNHIMLWLESHNEDILLFNEKIAKYSYEEIVNSVKYHNTLRILFK